MNPQRPVAIGGLGGSGTRVVAEGLEALGFYIGSDLPPSYDNSWFSVLFRRPRWFLNHVRRSQEAILTGLNLFTKAMTRPFDLRPGEVIFIVRLLAEVITDRYSHGLPQTGYAKISSHNGILRGRWFLREVWRMVHPNIDNSRYVGWGWKEPNTHIYLDCLKAYYQELKYIHLIRHGLDMAYSRNQNQLFNWYQFFDIQLPSSAYLQPKAALEYWTKSNQRAVKIGEQLGQDRFLLVNYDNLCISPRAEIERIINFLEVGPKKGLDMDNLCHIPQQIGSTGRYKNQSLRAFDPPDLGAVRQFGFAVEDTSEG